MIIVLCGYMGSGKTLIGKKLSQELGIDYKDLDKEIELRENLKIEEIFDQKGEIYFRRKEIEVLKSCLEREENYVLTLGGGTPCYGNNLEIIKNNPETILVYLKVNLDVLTERLFTEKEQRPLIKDISSPEDLNDFIRKHLFERQYYYMQSHFNVDNSLNHPDDTVEHILKKLQEFPVKKLKN